MFWGYPRLVLKVDKSAEDMVKRVLFEEEYEINGKKDVQGKAGILFFYVLGFCIHGMKLSSSVT